MHTIQHKTAATDARIPTILHMSHIRQHRSVLRKVRLNAKRQGQSDLLTKSKAHLRTLLGALCELKIINHKILF